MKNIKYIGLLVFVVLFTSCEKLLKEDPKYSINNKTAFETEFGANIALNGCYGYLTTYGAYGHQTSELLIGGSGLTWSQTASDDNDFMVSLAMVPTGGLIKSAWSAYYKVIGQCNYFINSVSESNLSESYKTQAIGEAKFLRAFAYFNLANLFGDVPLRLEPTDKATIAIARTPKEQVYLQVEKDWLAAAQSLKTKEQLGGASYGKATKYAAYAYLAKLYFTLASRDNNSSSPYWAKAKEMGDKVILEGIYDLEPKFAKLFVNYSNGSAESIFQINFSTTSLYAGNRNNYVYAPPGSTTGTSFARDRVAKAFYDFFKGSYVDDPRLKETFLTGYAAVTNNLMAYSYPYIRTGNVGTPSAPLYKILDSIKYEGLSDPTNPKISEVSTRIVNLFTKANGEHLGWPYYKKQIDLVSVAGNSNKNMMLYRYADFLLLMAEVENELGNKDKSIEYINKVLTRARTSANTPSVYPKDVPGSITKDDLRVKIFYERLFELAGEPETFFDVRRRGIDYLKLIVDRNNNHHITRAFVDYAAANNFTTRFRDRLLPATPELLKKNLLLPIPVDEINTNDAIGENDQNFGY